MNTDTRYIDTVDAAKMLRALLKKRFPGVKFSVQSSRYAGGSSIHIDWVNGPSESKVRELTQPYAGAGFDSMTDMQYYTTAILLADGTVTYGSKPETYGSDGYKNALPEGAQYVRFGCDYVQTGRDTTSEGIAALLKWFNKNELRYEEDALWIEETQYGDRLHCTPHSREAADRFYRMVHETDLPFVAPETEPARYWDAQTGTEVVYEVPKVG